MKILVTIFVLFFSTTLSASTLIIDCDNFGYKINTKSETVKFKSKSTDYKWTDSKTRLITNNIDELEIVLASAPDNPWRSTEKKNDSWDRLRIVLGTANKGYPSMLFYDSYEISEELKISGCSYSKK